MKEADVKRIHQIKKKKTIIKRFEKEFQKRFEFKKTHKKEFSEILDQNNIEKIVHFLARMTNEYGTIQGEFFEDFLIEMCEHYVQLNRLEKEHLAALYPKPTIEMEPT